MANFHYDLCIIGGGINGAGIARDAAGRGLSVLLVEAGDLAAGTSSYSTKLIHGGLRYLEQFQFRLVRESLRERSTLLKIAPHIVYPSEFIFVHDPSLRPGWMVRLGLFMYDVMAGHKSLPWSRAIEFGIEHYGDPLKNHYGQGFLYYDCRTDDARLVVLNAIDAARHRATILTRTACEALRPDGNKWVVTLRDTVRQEAFEISASMIVNATGPWAGHFLEQNGFYANDQEIPKLRLVKGSHIILPRLYEGDHVYVLQQPDRRIVFTLPYEQNYTMIGTTEEEFESDPAQAQVSEEELHYLCAAVNRAFEKEIHPADTVFTFTGVRPLIDDGRQNISNMSRDYRLYHHKIYTPPMISIFGGKLTTYRAIAEETVNMLMDFIEKPSPAWTAQAPLPGGDMPEGWKAFLQQQQNRYRWLPEILLYHYVSLYGTCMDIFLQNSGSLADLGKHYGDNLYAAEIMYLIKYEWARTVSDILWRRTKYGLHVSEQTTKNLQQALVNI